ncbi:MAG: hypothetical protein P8H03_08500, partial [Emcibacteraceae bacterium]|nr:hypothetical protein [Emcibacteraceae bacterium]
MNAAIHKKSIGEKLFTTFKYAIYILLTYNIYLFFVDDIAASSHTFSEGIDLSNVMEAFTSTIDTVNWVVLLLLFELETCVISDETLEKKGVKWILMATRAICYSLIVYAVYGYFVKFFMLHDVSPFAIEDVCSLAGGPLAMVIDMDEYIFITAENCQTLIGQELFKINGQDLISNPEALSSAQGLSWADIVNSTSWLGVVIVLEVDVWFQLKGLLKGMLLRISTIIKLILYTALVG